jgi:hypothetical protein
MSAITVDLCGPWRLYWNETTTQPWGSTVHGTVTRADGSVGALIRMASGTYMQGNAGCLRSLPQSMTIEAIKNTPLRFK